MIRPRLSAAALLVLALALTGCAVGVASHAGTPFTACLREAGVDLSEMGSWSRSDEQQALSDAGAMGCVLSDLPAGERREVLGWAFPDVPEGASAEQQAPVVEAVGAFLAQHDAAEPGTIADAGRLLVALGVRGPEPAGIRHALALGPHREAAGPLYDAWRDDAGLDDDPVARGRFVKEQLSAGGALAELFSETSDALLDAQQAAAREG
jgi:hypothetical protein